MTPTGARQIDLRGLGWTLRPAVNRHASWFKDV